MSSGQWIFVLALVGFFGGLLLLVWQARRMTPATADDLSVVVEQTPDGTWHATLYDDGRRVRDIEHPFGPGMAFSFRWSARRGARRALRYERKRRLGLKSEEIR